MSLAALAAPIVVKGAEAFSKAAGEKLGGKIDQLSQAVINKFKGDSDAEETLALAKKKPESEGMQKALEEVLAEKIETDQDFAKNLRALIENIQREQGSTRTTFDLRGQTIHGTQTIIDTVQGSVNIGDSKKDGKQ